MTLENRYVVLKRSDIEQHLNDKEKAALATICDLINNGRRSVNKRSISALVIENDWPEYEPTLRMLEERVDQ